MLDGYIFLTIGMLFITGIFCLVIALNQLSGPSRPTNIQRIPVKQDEDGLEQPKLTKLGRPIEPVKLSA